MCLDLSFKFFYIYIHYINAIIHYIYNIFDNINNKYSIIYIKQYVSDTHNENGHRDVPMADIDFKISSHYSVHSQPPFCINISWKYISFQEFLSPLPHLTVPYLFNSVATQGVYHCKQMDFDIRLLASLTTIRVFHFILQLEYKVETR